MKLNLLLFACFLSQFCLGQVQGKGNRGIQFIGGAVSRFDSLVARFKGTPVFVDIWATWCAPCRREFKKVAFLQEMAANEKFVLLYISGDKDMDSVKWRTVIQKNNLTGYHLRMNSKLKADITERFARPLRSTGAFALIYPTYVIVGRDGKIVNPNAPRPSEADGLKKELAGLK